MRETPIRPMAQLTQDYFRLLPFNPAEIPRRAFEEVVAEKVRAASQRSKIRDLHDLSELAKRPLNAERIRALVLLKLWNAGGPGLSFDTFRQRLEGDADYDVGDLWALLRKEERPDLAAMIGFRGRAPAFSGCSSRRISGRGRRRSICWVPVIIAKGWCVIAKPSPTNGLCASVAERAFGLLPHWCEEAAMRTFSIFVHHANSATPSLMFEMASDEAMLKAVAEKTLAGSRDWVAVEVREDDRLVLRLARNDATCPVHPVGSS
jgi:hypothetical protein